MSSFSDFPLSDKLKGAVADLGFTAPLPIQEKVIPLALERRDVVGCAPTGTGKTLAFLLPIMDGLLEMGRVRRFRPRALILLPTRELAIQVGEVFRSLATKTGLRSVVVCGGMDLSEQEQQMQLGVDAVIATPGRLIEHLERQGLKFAELEYLVLDEADRMLDEGFLPDIRRIVDQIPDRRQTMLFSATMPPEMEKFARELLSEPARIQVGLVAPKDSIEERAYPVIEEQKVDLLKAIFEREQGFEKVLVFVRTRARARELVEPLQAVTGSVARELHAELTQKERTAALDAFRSGECKLLVATDVASRGLDIEALSHVVNFDVPNTPDEYIHRIGRTGRVDRTGIAITLVSPKEQTLFMAIDNAVRRPIVTRRVEGFPYIFPEDEFGEGGSESSKRKRRGSTSFRPTEASAGEKENPFTKSGHLKKKYQHRELEEGPRRNSRKRIEKKIKNKKLPHQKG
ncbi:DEAD/DEAH box helicase [bacterium]|nr:DEAD/DEAH box helicase [bacterium]